MPVVASTAVMRRRHWEVLLLSAAALLAAPFLVVLSSEQVAVRAAPGVVLPPTCVSREYFGVNCPGCGLTRSWVHMAHGAWQESLRAHRLGWLLMAAAVVQIPYRAHLLFGSGRFALNATASKIVGAVLIGLLFVNWGLAIVGY
jgi:hypothetical protein